MASASSIATTDRPSAWTRFWHEPVRAERLGLMRLLLGLALLSDQLVQYLPNLMEFFGYSGVAPRGLHDAFQLRSWRWTVLLFNHDDPAVLYPFFWAWVGVTAAWTAGLLTPLSGALTWLGTMCWVNRNPNILNGGDDTLQVALFILLLAPCGRALSLDAWWRRRRTGDTAPALVPPWAVRLVQVQLCVIYLTTGLVKLKGEGLSPAGWPLGTWWDGTSVHYALNYVTMSRWSFAQFPQPLWLTAPLTYLSVWWEVLFPLLVLWRPTRTAALGFGLLFHIGIWLTIEVGWFSFYTMTYYAVWVPDWYWARYDRTA